MKGKMFYMSKIDLEKCNDSCELLDSEYKRGFNQACFDNVFACVMGFLGGGFFTVLMFSLLVLK